MASDAPAPRSGTYLPLDQAMKLPDYVERLVSVEYPEQVQKTFLMTYRDYATAPAILLILSRLYQTTGFRVRQNIVALMRTWLTYLWTDFSEDSDAAQALAETVISFVDLDTSAHDISLLLSKRINAARTSAVRVGYDDEEELVSVGNATLTYTSKFGNIAKEDNYELVKRHFMDPNKGVAFSWKPYKKDLYYAFTGASAVDWFIAQKYAKTREEGLRLGWRLWGEGLISHIMNEHIFRDEPLLYHFPARPTPPEFLPRKLSNRRELTSVQDLDASDLAKQLCLLDMELFLSIQPAELLGAGWTKANKAVVAPHVVAAIAHFNRLGYWTQTEILNCREKPARLKMAAYYVKVAEVLLKLRNYNAALAIIAALGTHIIRKLGEELELPPKTIKSLEAMRKTLDLHGIKDPRHPMRITSPNLPYLGTFLTEIITLEEGHPRTIGDLINFRRYHLTGQILHELDRHKAYSIDVMPLQEFFDYFKNATVLNEKALDDIATALRPRKISSPPPLIRSVTQANIDPNQISPLTTTVPHVRPTTTWSTLASARMEMSSSHPKLSTPEKEKEKEVTSSHSPSLGLLLNLPSSPIPAEIRVSSSTPNLHQDTLPSGASPGSSPPPSLMSSTTSISNASLTGSTSSIKQNITDSNSSIASASEFYSMSHHDLVVMVERQKREITKLQKKLNREKHAVQVMKEELEAKEKEVEQLRKEKEAMVVAKTAQVS